VFKSSINIVQSWWGKLTNMQHANVEFIVSFSDLQVNS